MREEFLLHIIDALPEGISEVMMHPGVNDDVLKARYNYDLHWEEELSAITSPTVRQHVTNNNINLISFRELEYE